MKKIRFNLPTQDQIPFDILKQLTAGDRKVLDWLYYLLRANRRRTHSRDPEIQPSIGYLAQQTELSYDWARECLWRLHHLGLIEITQRRGPNGWFKTHLYRIGRVIRERITQLWQQVKPQLSPSIWSPPRRKVNTNEIRDLDVRPFFQKVYQVLSEGVKTDREGQ